MASYETGNVKMGSISNGKDDPGRNNSNEIGFVFESSWRSRHLFPSILAACTRYCNPGTLSGWVSTERPSIGMIIERGVDVVMSCLKVKFSYMVKGTAATDKGRENGKRPVIL